MPTINLTADELAAVTAAIRPAGTGSTPTIDITEQIIVRGIVLTRRGDT